MFHPIFRALYQELDEEQRANPNLLAYPQHRGVGVFDKKRISGSTKILWMEEIVHQLVTIGT